MRLLGGLAGLAVSVLVSGAASAQVPAACGAVEPLSKASAALAASDKSPERGFRATSFPLPAAGGKVACAKSLAPPPMQAVDVLPIERFSLNGAPMVAVFDGPTAFVGPASAGLPARSDPPGPGVQACRFVELGGKAFTLCVTTVDQRGLFEVRGAARGGDFIGYLAVDLTVAGKWTEFDTSRLPELSADRSGGRMVGAWTPKLIGAIPYGYKAVFEGGAFAQVANGLQSGETLRMKVWRKDGQAVEGTFPADGVVEQLRSALAVAQAITPPR